MLLTNPSTTSTGIYTISRKQIALDLGYSVETVDVFMDRYINHHKIIKYNTETRELALKNWGKYNLGRGGKPVMDCLTKELSMVKDKSLIQYIAENIKSEPIQKLYKSFFEDNTASERIVPPEGDNKNKDKEKEIDKQEEIKRDINKDINKDINTDIEDSTKVNINKSNKKSFDKEGETLSASDNNNFSEYLDEAALTLSNYYKTVTGSMEGLDFNQLKLLINKHKAINVKHAIEKSLASKKCSLSYISGILRNWEKEGYPSDEEKLKEPKVPNQAGKLLKFGDYPQRQYDYDELEEKLLGWYS
ncbi:DnaD domain protein [Clostridium manihotivorum]|nr:DnaD domain protein [Clostridium manihotivorum]